MPRWHDKSLTPPGMRRAPKGSIVDKLLVPLSASEVEDIELLTKYLESHPQANPMHDANAAGALRWATSETVERLGLRPPRQRPTPE